MASRKIPKTTPPKKRSEGSAPRKRATKPKSKPAAKKKAGKRKTGLGKVDDGLLFALRHPLRLRMLVSLNEEGDGSPSDLAKRLESTTEHCSHHIKVLEEYGYVEFVRKELVSTGAKSIYRAIRKVEFPQEIWEQLPPAVQNQVVTGLFMSSFGDAEAALLSGAFEKYPESHASWTHLHLDQKRWKQLRNLLERTLVKVLEIGREAEEHEDAAEEAGEDLLTVSFSLLAYPLPDDAWPTDDDRPTFLQHGGSNDK
jgi:DNA-binding transcriptional ArsR family regulator